MNWNNLQSWEDKVPNLPFGSPGRLKVIVSRFHEERHLMRRLLFHGGQWGQNKLASFSFSHFLSFIQCHVTEILREKGKELVVRILTSLQDICSTNNTGFSLEMTHYPSWGIHFPPWPEVGQIKWIQLKRKMPPFCTLKLVTMSI